jgi:hypothetical protein
VTRIEGRAEYERGSYIYIGPNEESPVLPSNIRPRANFANNTQQAMLYNEELIEKNIEVLRSHAGEPHTVTYGSIARLSAQSLRFHRMTEAHAQGFGGTATDPEVMRCTEMLTNAERFGNGLETAVTQLGFVLKDRDSILALSNLRQLVTEK